MTLDESRLRRIADVLDRHRDSLHTNYGIAAMVLDALGFPTAAEPEAGCNRCAGPNVPWSAPSPLWNEVMRGGDINGPWQYGEIICPTCFAVLAEEAGVASMWRLRADVVHVPLTTVTPSGRVWNEATQLWDVVHEHSEGNEPFPGCPACPTDASGDEVQS